MSKIKGGTKIQHRCGHWQTYIYPSFADPAVIKEWSTYLCGNCAAEKLEIGGKWRGQINESNTARI